MLGFPDSSVVKESTCNAGDPGLIPGLGRSPGEGKGYPLQYSGLENSMDCTVHGITKGWTWQSDFHFHFSLHLIAYIFVAGYISTVSNTLRILIFELAYSYFEKMCFFLVIFPFISSSLCMWEVICSLSQERNVSRTGGGKGAYRWLCIYFLKLKLLEGSFQVHNDYI